MAFHPKQSQMTLSQKPQDVFDVFAKFQILLLYSKLSILQWGLISFAPLTTYLLFTLTWASDSPTRVHSVGTHVEYTCKTKHRDVICPQV